MGPEALPLLSTTADNYMACTINFLVVVTRGSLSYPFRYLGLFLNCHCQSVFHTELMNSTYRALKGSTSRIPLQNSPIHLHLLLHICFHSHRLPLLSLTLAGCCLFSFFTSILYIRKQVKKKVHFLPKNMSY